MNFKVGFLVDNPTSDIKNSVEATYLNGTDPVLVIAVDCYFEVVPESWSEMTRADKSIVIPSRFLQDMVAITLDGLRGVLCAKTEGSKNYRYLVPFINVDEMVKNDMVITPQDAE